MERDLYRMAVFSHVVSERSFSAAGAKLGIGKSNVSQQLRILEDHLGVRLLNRSTRGVSLTSDGEVFHAHCLKMLEAAQRAFESTSADTLALRGPISITAPHNLGLEFLAGVLHKFRELNPQVELKLSLDDSISSLADGKLDLAIRVGPLPDSSLLVSKLCSYELYICCGADFAQDMVPINPEELAAAPWIEFPRSSVGNTLVLRSDDGETATVKVQPVITTNSSAAVQKFLMLGAGIGIVPSYAARDHLASGALIRVLKTWRLRKGQISCLYQNRAQPARVRELKDFLKREFRYLETR